MITITEKLYNKKIVLISLLKSKGIYNKALFSRIMNSTKQYLNLIHAKHIKHTRVNDKSFFKHIIKDKYFRLKTSIDDKKDILCIEIDKILQNRYYNNKSNIIFQEFIQYLLELLDDPKVHYYNTHLFIDLLKWVKSKYVVTNEINIINEIRKAGKYTLKKLKLVNELIDYIDYLNYLNNDITKLEKLRMGIDKTLDAYIIEFKGKIQSFVKSDKDLMEIYTKLNTDAINIKTKLLYNKLVDLKEDLRKRMHNIKYGIIENNDKIETSGDQFTTQVMPFMESGKLNLSDKQFRNLHINTIYFKKSDQKSINAFKNGYYNKVKIHGRINIIFEGINPYNKGKYQKSYIIQYQYVTTTKQNNQFKSMKRKLKRSLINNKKYNKVNDFKGYIECSYNYPYLNQTKNFNAFKEYYKDLTHLNTIVKYRDLYPYIARTSQQKNKFLNFTSFNNNIWRDYLLRTRINRSLANIIYRLDFNREITDFYNPKNQMNYTKRNQRLFLSNIIKEISKDQTLTKLFKEFLTTLIKEYNNRIYLFQIYGIDALKNQIVQLQTYYNTNYKGKWDYRTRDINKLIRKLTKLIKHRKIYLDFIMMQKFTVNKFLDKFEGSNILIQSIIDLNIKKYTSKSLIRKITIQRSKVECIKICCNNLKSFKVNYLNSRPVYIKEIKDEFTKFDELLGTSETYKIQYIDKETSIDIIQYFKCITKFDRYLDLNELYDRLLDFKINDNNTLKSYLYKEKSILNQF